MRLVVCGVIVCLSAGTAKAADYYADAGNYQLFIAKLRPGDRLLLAPGDYRSGLALHTLSGRRGQPIVIEAANPDTPPRLIARSHANTVSLVDVRHLILRHLELDGQNLPVDAIKAEGHSRYADYVTLEHLYIHDHAVSQQNVGISTKCPAFGWVVRANRIMRVGTGMYFGDSDGSDPFVSGTIESNLISQTVGYSLQIKHQKSRPSSHVGRHDTKIRYNVFAKQNYLPGPHARPNVLLGHFPLWGVGNKDRYLVYGNLFLQNPGEALFQAEGRVAVYDNVFINAGGDAINIQPHNDEPQDMAIFSNTILAAGAGIRVRRGATPSYRQRIIANVVSATAPLRGGEAAYNVTLPYRADLSSLPAADLTAHLLAADPVRPQLPESLVREFAAYPGAGGSMRLGAKLSRKQLHILETMAR